MKRDARIGALHALIAERILVLDGAMGTMQQGYCLTEEQYRGARFAKHNHDLKGDHDILALTKPEIIREIHDQYFAAGADIVETSTFTSTSVSQSDYGLAHLAREINVAAARIARASADAFEAKDGRPRFVAGAIGPTNKTCSISPDVSDPGRRDISFDALRDSYREDAEGLIKQFQVLPAVHQESAQAEIKVVAPRDIDVTEGRGHVRHPSRMDVKPGRVKNAAEVQKIVEQITHFEVG